MKLAGKIPKSREVDALEWREFLRRPSGSGRESDNNEPCAGGADQDRQRRLVTFESNVDATPPTGTARRFALGAAAAISALRTAIGARAALET